MRTLLATEAFWLENKQTLKGNFDLHLCSPQELEAVSSFKTNNSVLAVTEIKNISIPKHLKGLTLVLDSIKDPGNLGTLIRVADWYGVENIIASKDTVDLYTPKVLQASMGSFLRVKVSYTALEDYLKNISLPVYLAQPNGENVHDFSFEKNCLVLLGSESHGVHVPLISSVKKRIGIPSYGRTESLNVAVSAAVICDNYRRTNSHPMLG